MVEANCVADLGWIEELRKRRCHRIIVSAFQIVRCLLSLREIKATLTIFKSVSAFMLLDSATR